MLDNKDKEGDKPKVPIQMISVTIVIESVTGLLNVDCRIDVHQDKRVIEIIEIKTLMIAGDNPLLKNLEILENLNPQVEIKVHKKKRIEEEGQHHLKGFLTS